MAEAGIREPDITQAGTLDFVRGLQTVDGIERSRLQPIDSLSQQLLANGPLADRISAVGGGYDASVALVADLPPLANGKLGRVFGEPVTASRGIYKVTGGVWTRIGPLPEGDTAALDARLDAAEAALDGKADISALSAEAATRVAADTALEDALDGKADATALATEVAARTAVLSVEAAARSAADEDLRKAIRTLPLAEDVHSRPGDAREHYVFSLDGGDPASLPAIPESHVRFDDAGRAIGLTGSGLLANRVYDPVEQGHNYLCEFVLQRRVDSPDPANEGIRCGVAWYDRNWNHIGQAVIQDLLAVTTGSGRVTVEAVVARAAGSGVDIVAPANARYARRFVQTYGVTVRTDVEVMRRTDITHAGAYSPDLSSLSGRVGAVESINAGNRLTVLEAAVTAPHTLRLKTVGDLVAANVGPTVGRVEVQGFAVPGDGGAAAFRRGANVPGAIQSADMAWWEIDEGEEELHVAMFGAKSNGVTPDDSAFVKAVTVAAARGKLLKFKSGATLLLKDKHEFTLPGKAVRWQSDGAAKARILIDDDGAGQPIAIAGQEVARVSLAANAAVHGKVITLDNASAVQAGHLVGLLSNKAWYHDPRARLGLSPTFTYNIVSANAGTFEVVFSTVFTGLDLTGAVVTFRNATETVSIGSTVLAYNVGTRTATFSSFQSQSLNNSWKATASVDASYGSVAGGSANTVILGPADVFPALDPVGMAITIVSGANAGEARDIVAYNSATHVATVDRNWSSPPASGRYILGAQCCRGELQRVRSVAGNDVTVEAALFDGYDVDDDEEVAVIVANPVRVEIDNIEFEWKRGTATAIELVQVTHGSDCRLSRCIARNGVRVGFQFVHCYNSKVADCEAHDSNEFYTGYGFASHGSTYTCVTSCKAVGCKKGMDAHSTYTMVDTYPSHEACFEHSIVIGAGKRSDGVAWGAQGGVDPVGSGSADDEGQSAAAARNFGSGSHGASDGFHHRFNTYVKVHCPHYMRGRNEQAIGNRYVAAIDVPAKVWFGGNVKLKDNEYVHYADVRGEPTAAWFSEFQLFTANPWQYFTPWYGIEILGAASSGSLGPFRKGEIELVGNRFPFLRKAFVFFGLSGSDGLADLKLRDNHVSLCPEDAARTVFMFNSSNNGQLRRFEDIDNEVAVLAGDYRRYRAQTTIDLSTSRVRIPGGNRQWAEFLATDAYNPPLERTSVPLSGSGTRILSVTHTPSFNGAPTHVRFVGQATRTGGAGRVIAALFRRNTATNITTCLDAKEVNVVTPDQYMPVVLEHPNDDAGSTGPQEYFVSVGRESGTTGAVRMNGDSAGTALMGGKQKCTLIVTETLP